MDEFPVFVLLTVFELCVLGNSWIELTIKIIQPCILYNGVEVFIVDFQNRIFKKRKQQYSSFFIYKYIISKAKC